MSCSNIFSYAQDDECVHLEVIEKQPLAFSTADNLICATSRLPFVTEDRSAVLNVECFFFDDEYNDEAYFRDLEGTDDTSDSSTQKHSRLKAAPLFLYVHGVCSSAETVAVQHIVKLAKKKRYRVAVLELEGHGLSSGARAVCGDFKRMVGHVTQFVKHVLTEISQQTTVKSLLSSPKYNGSIKGKQPTPFVLCGSSLGGSLVAYAADLISKTLTQYPGQFLGVALIAPAVGVDAKALPGPITLNALKLASCITPTTTISLTPMSDPISYAAPKNSTRNYHGHWPLATSHMLVDITSGSIKTDIENGILTMNKVNSLIVFSGAADEVVPFESVKEFFESINAREKALINVPGEGHDLMYQSVSATEIVNQIFQWMELRMWAVGRADGTNP